MAFRVFPGRWAILAVAAVAVAAATAAWADIRTNSASNETRAEACHDAKDMAAGLVQTSQGRPPSEFSSCNCSERPEHAGTDAQWFCSVDARFTSGLSRTAVSSAVTNTLEFASTQAQACEQAKGRAPGKIAFEGGRPEVERFGACDCSERPEHRGTDTQWVCAVNAYYVWPED